MVSSIIYLLLMSTSQATERDFVAEVQRLIVAEITERLSVQPTDVTVHQLGIRNSEQCRQADVIQIDIPPQEDFRGKTLVVVEGWEAGQQCGRWTIQAWIEIWTELPVSQTTVAAGDVVSIGWERGRLDQVRAPLFVKGPDELVLQSQWVSMVPLQQGEVLTRTHLRRKPDFKQGDAVTILVQKGTLTIRVEGILIRDTYIGGMAKVRTESLNSIVEGIITETGEVLLK